MTDLHDQSSLPDESGIWETDALLDALGAGLPVADVRMAALLGALVSDVGADPLPALPVAPGRTRLHRLAPRTAIAAAAVVVVLSTGGVAAASVNAGPTSPLFPLHRVLTGQPQLDGSQRQALEVQDKLRSASKALAAGKVARAQQDVAAAASRLPKVAMTDGQGSLAAQWTALNRRVKAQVVAPVRTGAPSTPKPTPTHHAPGHTATPTPKPTHSVAPADLGSGDDHHRLAGCRARADDVGGPADHVSDHDADTQPDAGHQRADQHPGRLEPGSADAEQHPQQAPQAGQGRRRQGWRWQGRRHRTWLTAGAERVRAARVGRAERFRRPRDRAPGNRAGDTGAVGRLSRPTRLDPCRRRRSRRRRRGPRRRTRGRSPS